MNKESKSSSGGGIGLLSAVFLVFLVLKLTGHIDWSWWWITAPLWIPASIVGGLLVIIGVTFLVVLIVKE